MINFLDMMRHAQGGAAIDNMARQFGLSSSETQRAMAALMPAFALPLQHNANNQAALAGFMRLIGSGHFAGFFDSAAQAFSPQARSEGDQALGQLFGSSDLSRRIADQAATWSGVSAQLLQQMMPVLAAMLMGGLTKSLSAQGLGGCFGQTNATSRNADPMPNPLTAWAQMVGAMMGSPAEKPSPPAPAGLPNPWADMLRAMSGQPQAEPPKPEPEQVTSGASDGFERMMDAGRQAQEQYLASLQTIFDTFWGTEPSRR